ncbi:transcriptional regulator [Escherichia coli]|uniref:PapB/FocB family fimbrial expression transcriptional regulator n=1 Tax=Escherichia coli TaxID=562 RepID=UPI000A38721A|nr:PapB/FocB family fimbrial expression transcriptional regulator [Escherichia coli]OUK46032.1 transcriptional regulator [Escherichia coli]
MSSSDLYLSKKHGCTLSPGKVLNALRDFLVLGYTRREACERHEVSQGYFSGALGRIQRTHQAVNRLVPFYISEAGIPYTG